MNREQYIRELSGCLKGLSAEDREDAIRFYEDYIEESGLGDSATIEESLGTPKEVARKIVGDCVEKQIDRQSENPDLKNSKKTVWLILLAIMASPVALPLMIVAVVVYLCMVIAMFCIDVGVLFGGFFGGICGGFVMIVAAFWTSGAAQGMVLVGMGLMWIAVGIACCIGFYKLNGLFVALLVKIHRRIFGKVEKKRV